MSDTTFFPTLCPLIHYWWTTHHAQRRGKKPRPLDVEDQEEGEHPVEGVDRVVGVDQGDEVGQGVGDSRCLRYQRNRLRSRWLRS